MDLADFPLNHRLRFAAMAHIREWHFFHATRALEDQTRQVANWQQRHPEGGEAIERIHRLFHAAFHISEVWCRVVTRYRGRAINGDIIDATEEELINLWNGCDEAVRDVQEIVDDIREQLGQLGVN